MLAREQRSRAGPTNPGASGTRGMKPRFRRGGRERFIKSVNQAWLDNVEEEEVDLCAHMADDEEEVTNDEPVMDTQEDDGPVGDGDSAAQALAAIGLENLLNW